jgi:hypothetical protein
MRRFIAEIGDEVNLPVCLRADGRLWLGKIREVPQSWWRIKANDFAPYLQPDSALRASFVPVF